MVNYKSNTAVFLLLLTRAFIPFDIQSVITGNVFVLNFPSLMHINFFGLYNSSIGYFNFDLSNQRLEQLSIESDSSFYNIYPIIIFTLMMFPLHL